MGYKLNRIMMWVNNTTRGLPAEYQEVEYIQSSRTQVINTGVIPTTQTYTAELEVESAESGAEYWAFGIWGTTGFRGGQDSSGHWDTSFGGLYEPSSYNLNTKTKITMSNAGKGTSTNTAIGLFGMGENGAYANNRKGAYKIYYCKIWDNGTLIRDFVPCYRKLDNVIGMYDLVNDQFYTNSGTGTFTKGADIPDMVEKQVRPPRPAAYEISYDLRGGTLAGLQAAGFDGVAVNGGYQFTSDGLQQTSTGNDKGVSVYKTGLDLTNAKKITIRSLGYWYRSSWSNGKDVALIQSEAFTPTINDRPSVRYPRRLGNIVPNTNSASYCNQGIYYANSSGTETAISQTSIRTIQSGDTTLELILDLENKTVNFTHSGANNNSWNATLTDAQITEIRGMKSAVWNWGRGYSSNDAYERLKEVYLKIEY